MTESKDREAELPEIPPEPKTTVFYSREALEQKFRSGEFDRLKTDLKQFVARHRDEIKQAADLLPEVVDRKVRVIETIETLIEESKSVSPAAEMADQIHEINNEIWYRGEEGQTDRHRISEEWTRRYAAKWRNARLQELQFLIRATADELLAVVGE